MKKNALKVVMFVFCVGVVVFLLLPFLETESAQSAAAQGDKPAPQIFTSNPLTSIVQRLASLFRKSNKKANNPQQQQVALSNEQVNERFGVPQYARGAAANGDNTDLIASAGTNAALNPDGSEGKEGENWVLIPQTSPEDSAPGMHEINVKDNAYDNYLLQQKAASYNPALQASAYQQKLPYWKRLINPITKLFSSNKEGTKTQGQGQAYELGAGGQLANGDNLLSNSTNVASGLPRMTSPQFPNLRGPNVGAAGNRTAEAYNREAAKQAVSNVIDLFTQDSAIERAAKMWAEAKYPNPDQKDKRKSAQARQKDALKKEWNDKVHSVIEAVSKGEGTDLTAALKDMFLSNEGNEQQNGGCVKALPYGEGACGVGGSKDTSDIKEKFGKQMEGLVETMPWIAKIAIPTTPVLGFAKLPAANDPSEGEQTQESIEQNKDKSTYDIAKYLYEKNGCSDNNQCAWVANSVQKDPAITNAVDATYQHLVGDPLGIYEEYRNDYIQKTVDKQMESVKDASEEEKAQKRKELEEQVGKAYDDLAPAWIPYNSKQLKQGQQPIKTMAQGKDLAEKDNPTVFHLIEQQQASKFSKEIDSNVFWFPVDGAELAQKGQTQGKTSTGTGTGTGTGTSTETSTKKSVKGLQDNEVSQTEAVVETVSDDVKTIMSIKDDVLGPTTQEALNNGLQEAMKKFEGNGSVSLKDAYKATREFQKEQKLKQQQNRR